MYLKVAVSSGFNTVTGILSPAVSCSPESAHYGRVHKTIVLSLPHFFQNRVALCNLILPSFAK